MEPAPNHITDFMRSQKAPEEEPKSPKSAKEKAKSNDDGDVIALALGGEMKKEKKKKKDKQHDPEKTAKRKAAREAKAQAALESAQRSVGAVPASTSATSLEGSSVPASPFMGREAAASPVPASAGAGGAELSSEGEAKAPAASVPVEKPGDGAEVKAGGNREGGADSDEEFFGPFAAKKSNASQLKPAPSALFGNNGADSNGAAGAAAAPKEEEKVGVNFDEDLSLGGTAITRIAGLSVSQKRSGSSKNLNLIGPRANANSSVKEADLTRVGQLEIEEGKVLKSWKKVKVVLKNNKLVIYDKTETSVSLDEVLRYDEAQGRERVFYVQLKDTKDSVIFLRAKTPAESADWVKAIKTSVAYHQSIFQDPTLPEVLVILSCKREPSNPMSFTFQQFGTQDRVYMTMISAILLELLLQDRIKIQKQKLLPASETPQFTGDSLFDDVISYISQAYMKDKKAGGISVREFIKLASNLKSAEPVLGDVWRRAVVRAARKKYVEHQGGQKFVIRNEELETQCIDLIRNLSFKPGAVPSGPRELCIFAMSYAVIRTFRKSPHEQNVIQKQNIFQSDEIRTKVHVNSMQAAMDRFSKGVGTVPETIAASIREVCAGCYYCGRGE